MGRFVGASLAFKTEFKNRQVFESTGTFVASSVDGSDAVRITVLGPGANGSSTVGGAAGGFAQKTTFLKPGCAYCVTVGVPGVTSSFGSVVSATAGSGQTTAGCGVGGDVNYCGGCGASCIGYFNCCFLSSGCSFCHANIACAGTAYGYCAACCFCIYCCMLTAASGGGSPSLFGNGCNATNACAQPGLGSSKGGTLGFCYGQCANDEASLDACLAIAPQFPSDPTFGGASCGCACNYCSCFHNRVFTCGPSYQPNNVCAEVVIPFTYVPINIATSGCSQCSGSPTTVSVCSRTFAPNLACPHVKCCIGACRAETIFRYMCNSSCIQCGFTTFPGCVVSNCTLDPTILNRICRYVDQSSVLFGAQLGASGGADMWSRCCAFRTQTSYPQRIDAWNVLYGICTAMGNGCYGSGGASGGTQRWFCIQAAFGNCCVPHGSGCTVCRLAGCGGAGLVVVEW